MLLSTVPSAGGSGGSTRHSLIRLTATQQTAAEVGAETLRDLFWTLYSKLDAVLQGFRVAHECVQRISEVCALPASSLSLREMCAQRRKFSDSDEAPKTGTLVFSLLEVWKPVQSEVRTVDW